MAAHGHLTHGWKGAWVAVLGVAACGPTIVRADRPPAPKLLPEKTVLYLSVVDAPEMARRFQQTALGRMSQDPQLQPLVEHLYGSLGELVARFKDQVGLSLPQLLSIPQGELSLAMVAMEEGPPAGVVLLDAGPQIVNARTLLKRGGEALERAGAKRSEETISGTIVAIYRPSRGGGLPVAWFDKDGTIAASTRVEALEQLLAAWNGQQDRTLSTNEKFAAIMRRCQGTAQDSPQLFWFADPIEALKALAQDDPRARVGLAILPTLGLDGLLGLGGSWALDCGSIDELVHTHILLDSPRTGVLELLNLQPGETLPEPWVPADVASYLTLHWRLEPTYKSLARLYDSFRGEGAFANEVDRRINKPAGVDLAKDILPALDGRISYAGRLERPVSGTSQSFLLGLGLKNSEPIAKALEEACKRFETSITRHSISGKQYYQLPAFPRGPGGGPLRRLGRPSGQGPEPPEGEPRRPCLGIIGNCLVLADRPSCYEKALATLENPQDSLAESLMFKLVASRISRWSRPAKPALLMFQRPEEGFRFVYELVGSERTRENLRQGAERSGLLKSINAALEANPLPPFSVLEKYLAPSGAFIVDDETGLHYTGFTLRRK